MSQKIEELKAQVKTLFEKSTDPEVIKQAAVVSSKIDEIDKEETGLIDKNGDLLNKYKEAVLNAPLPPSHTEEADGQGQQPKTLEQCLADIRAKGK